MPTIIMLCNAPHNQTRMPTTGIITTTEIPAIIIEYNNKGKIFTALALRLNHIAALGAILSFKQIAGDNHIAIPKINVGITSNNAVDETVSGALSILAAELLSSKYCATKITVLKQKLRNVV